MSKKSISIIWNGLHPNYDMSKCEKMRYADLLQEGILENMTAFTRHYTLNILRDILGIEPSILISLKI